MDLSEIRGSDMEHTARNYPSQPAPQRTASGASKLGGVRRKGSGAHRAAAALQLFYEGKTYTEIARRVGYADKATAYKTVQRELAGMGKASRELAAAAMEEHLRAVWEAYYPLALGGDLDAAHMCLRLMERQARFYGLDEPKQYEQVHSGEVVVRAYPPEWIAATGLTPETAMTDSEPDTTPDTEPDIAPSSELDALAAVVREGRV